MILVKSFSKISLLSLFDCLPKIGYRVDCCSKLQLVLRLKERSRLATNLEWDGTSSEAELDSFAFVRIQTRLQTKTIRIEIIRIAIKNQLILLSDKAPLNCELIDKTD